LEHIKKLDYAETSLEDLYAEYYEFAIRIFFPKPPPTGCKAKRAFAIEFRKFARVNSIAYTTHGVITYHVKVDIPKRTNSRPPTESETIRVFLQTPQPKVVR
jgi:hypothetical protein